MTTITKDIFPIKHGGVAFSCWFSGRVYFTFNIRKRGVFGREISFAVGLFHHSLGRLYVVF